MVNLDCEEIAGRLDQIDALLGGATRAVECGRVLREAARAVTAGQPLEGEERVREFALAFQDASMIVAAFDALEKSDVATARDRLREAVTGDSVVVPNAGDDEPRNQMWTVFLGACFQRQGLTPRFADATRGERGMKKPDLFVTVNGAGLAVEAKRVRSYAKLGKHVKRAVEQVAAACDRGEADAGFVALDLSFAVEQHAQSGLWTLPNRSALPGVREQLIPVATKLLKSVGEMAGGHPGSRHVVGATLLLLPVVRYADTRQLGLVRHFVTGQFDGDRSSRGQTAYRTLHERCFSDR